MSGGDVAGAGEGRRCRWGRLRPLASGALAMLVVVATSLPAEAQRPGRRWRSVAPPSRIQPAPRSPGQSPPPPAAGTRDAAPPSGAPSAGTKAAAGAGGGAKPQGNAPPPGKRTGDKPPQTTGVKEPSPEKLPASLPAGPAGTPWGGPAPFSEAWRSEHPAAWRPETPDTAAVLVGGGREPTAVDAKGGEDVARTAADGADGDAPERSVLRASAESPAVDVDGGDADLVIFPPSGAALAAMPTPDSSVSSSAASEDGAGNTAADGTVSVLVRGDRPSALEADPTARSIIASAAPRDDDASPWLPLGAFAAVPRGSEAVLAPHVFLELALHRDGTVRGNYYDAVSDSVQGVSGRFDRDTGTLRWRIGGRGAEFETTADGLATGRVEATVRRGTGERTWVLIGLP